MDRRSGLKHTTKNRPIVRGLVEKTLKFGRGEQIRTADPWPPMPVRYQAAPRPDIRNFKDDAFYLLRLVWSTLKTALRHAFCESEQ
jgi:hypothetical protein